MWYFGQVNGYRPSSQEGGLFRFRFCRGTAFAIGASHMPSETRASIRGEKGKVGYPTLYVGSLRATI